MSSLKDQLLNSGKVKTSEEWDATYDELPVVIAEDAASLGQALEKLDTVGGYGYLAIWKKIFSCLIQNFYQNDVVLLMKMETC